jgi:hypothetical protein
MKLAEFAEKGYVFEYKYLGRFALFLKRACIFK